MKLLRQFADQQALALRQISEALAKNERTVAERMAHTLKGAAGSIGAKTVQSAAAAVEKLIREKGSDGELEAAIERADERTPRFIRLSISCGQPSVRSQAKMPPHY